MTAAAVWFALAVTIYRTDDEHAWEQGEIIARSCAEAEAMVRDGLLLGQAVMLGPCVERAAAP